MILKCLATGSKANCYVLKRDNGEMLILDAGLPIAEIKKGIGFDIENIKGCLCSHIHADHSRAVKSLRTIGVPVWCPFEYEEKRQRTRLGEFAVECFDLPHNGVENRGFIIVVDNQAICYITDAEYSPYTFRSKLLDTLIIECNYMKDLVSEDLPNLQHKVLGHMELETTLGIIQGNLKTLKHVILVHMGQGTLNREKAMQRIREVVPEWITVEWAKAGETYNLSDCPF